MSCLCELSWPIAQKSLPSAPTSRPSFCPSRLTTKWRPVAAPGDALVAVGLTPNRRLLRLAILDRVQHRRPSQQSAEFCRAEPSSSRFLPPGKQSIFFQRGQPVPSARRKSIGRLAERAMKQMTDAPCFSVVLPIVLPAYFADCPASCRCRRPAAASTLSANLVGLVVAGWPESGCTSAQRRWRSYPRPTLPVQRGRSRCELRD